MTRSLSLILALLVLAVSGCGKKTESPSQPAQPGGSNSASETRPAAPSAQASSPAATATPSPAVAAIPGELPIIGKARAFLGTEQALNAINEIHYTGTLVTNDPADPKKQTRAAIEIVLQKPDHQRVTITSDKTKEATALNGYEAWTRITAVNDPTKWQQTLLGVEGVKRLRANTWENLAFFRGLESEGGEVRDEGPATIDGVACEKVAFIHAPNIVFTRYFAKDTGRVVFTETESGSIREQGDVVVNGVRFPKSIITVSKTPSGQLQTVTVNFDKIAVNETLPPDLFSVPSLQNR